MKKKSNSRIPSFLVLTLLLFVLTACPPPVDPAVTPTLTTSNPETIDPFLAKSGGKVTNEGGADVTAKGVCWGTTTGPTLANSKTSDGTGVGNFSSLLSGLKPGMTYYVRAYATNSVGTAYGNEVSFITNATLSIITTTLASAITANSATSGGNVTSDGGGSITARGVC